MKMLCCPLNGLRNISEFVHGGELREMPDPNTCTDREWAEYVFYPPNHAGVIAEWWLHVPSGYWFIVERDRLTDEVLRTYDPAERFTTRVEFPSQSEETKA